jgi:hypothetical protein
VTDGRATRFELLDSDADADLALEWQTTQARVLNAPDTDVIDTLSGSAEHARDGEDVFVPYRPHPRV